MVQLPFKKVFKKVFFKSCLIDSIDTVLVAHSGGLGHHRNKGFIVKVRDLWPQGYTCFYRDLNATFKPFSNYYTVNFRQQGKNG